MWENISLTLNSYWQFYVRFFANQWHDLTPMRYGAMLIGIAGIGWLMMRNGLKRP